MAAPAGNQFWKQRSKHGRDKIFETPEMLWEAACEYFEWSNENPWIRYEAIKGGDNAGKLIAVPTSRPYTLEGLSIFLDVESRTLRNYMSDEKYKDFFPVLTRIEEIIRTQKFEGASVGAFNANIIARDLGLAEQTHITGSGLKIESSDPEKTSLLEEVREKLKEIDKDK